ncbi:quinoprotein dehydrogenase-associated putative ABC transporter substrate-binding protein [Aquisalimonas asiatica]|uniref:Quinoprotein dehydrogenase-associated probable ABC transporter substrate-binding protein n=1 Tax=Aquisalimonas asiatica TaxID=406100 RepID=A0A1H8UFH4_9GAMM|nr:quinoprotein dehydrogenase-associated putative ABC transporter substrate-binding protein [Aquisalimonas asiatica]SEP02002.1 quinoprotein dehydrogenase-associated probable ABC transporter substrate-binding protein [Aquisalimonas asiatica]
MHRRSWRTAIVACGLLCLSGAFGVPAWAGPPEITERGQLRVCADGNNLPFSNRDGEGFENRIADMMAEELDVPVTYVWAPQIMGFVRNTLDLGVCDVIIGVAAGYELVRNTNAYYRSVYSLIVPEDSDLDVSSLHDPALADLRLGAITDTPPVVPLRSAGASVKTYALQADTRVVSPVRNAVQDVADGVTQGAVLWGPIAGYYASRQDPPLRVLPLVGDTPGAHLQFRITMGVRRGEPRWMDWINDFIDRRQADIDAVLADYGVPLVDRHGQLIPVDSNEQGD